MKKAITTISLMLGVFSLYAQTYPFTQLCDPSGTPPPFPSPSLCYSNTISCENDNTGSLNYNVMYQLNNKFNFTNTFHNQATILKDNRSSAIDYFKETDCDLFLATVNTQGLVTRTNRNYTACILTTYKADMSINWEVSLAITDPLLSSAVCDIIPQDIYINAQSEIFICGKVISTSANPHRANDFAAKFDNTGALKWINYYVQSLATIQEDAANVILDNDNGTVIIAGQSEFITSTGNEKPYLVAINSTTGVSGGLVIDKSSLPFNGKYTDIVYIGDNKYVTVGTGVNLSSPVFDKDIICSVWELTGGTLQLLYNHFIGETGVSSSSPVIDECAWSVIKLGSYLIVASERKEGNGQSSTVISKLSISDLIAGTFPVVTTKQITHNNMLTDPNYSLVPVKLILPPYNVNKPTDHFSIVINRYLSLTTSGGFLISAIPVTTPTYSTNPVKANAFMVFELDDNLDEITNGTYNLFLSTDLEPMDVCATNNYYENIAILSLDNTDDDNFNIFVRSSLDHKNVICAKNCIEGVSDDCALEELPAPPNIYMTCMRSEDITHSSNTTASYSGSSMPNSFNNSVDFVTETTILEKCSTNCELSYSPKSIKERMKLNSNVINSIEDLQKEMIVNTTGKTNRLLITDILGRVIYNTNINSYDQLASITNSLPNGLFVLQLEVNSENYVFKLLK